MARRTTEDGEWRHGQQQDWFYKSRTHHAQIISIDEVNARCRIRLATTAEELTCIIPLGGFSVNGLQSSWIRYMPQVRDFVKLTFTVDNLPEITGYVAWGEELDPGQTGSVDTRTGGYATVRKFADSNVGGLQVFQRLKQGEWDMRSSGGAVIYGTQSGHLTLAAGAGAAIDLDKTRSEALHRAGLQELGGDGSEVRVGDVKRALGQAKETPIPANPLSVTVPPLLAGLVPLPPGKEHRVRVAYPLPLASPTAPQTYLTYYDAIAGDCRTDLGIPIVSLNTGLPVRARQRCYGVDGLVVNLKTEVDILGNVRVDIAPTAVLGGLDVSGPASPLSLSFLRAAIATEGPLTLSANGVPPTHPIAYGDALMTYLNSLVVLTALGPSSPPVVPFTPAMLSPGVKVG